MRFNSHLTLLVSHRNSPGLSSAATVSARPVHNRVQHGGGGGGEGLAPRVLCSKHRLCMLCHQLPHKDRPRRLGVKQVQLQLVSQKRVLWVGARRVRVVQAVECPLRQACVHHHGGHAGGGGNEERAPSTALPSQASRPMLPL